MGKSGSSEQSLKISTLVLLNEPKYRLYQINDSFFTTVNKGYFSSVFEVFEHGHFEYWEWDWNQLWIRSTSFGFKTLISEPFCQF